MGDLNKSEKKDFFPSVVHNSNENKFNQNISNPLKSNPPQNFSNSKQEVKKNDSPQNQNKTPQINKTEDKEGYSSGKNVSFLEPEIVEKTNWELKHAGLAVIFASILILAQFGVMTFLKLEATHSWILAFILIVIFGVVIYFLLEPRKEREIRQKIIETELKTIDRPVDREVIRTIEVEKPVVREIPVIKEVPVYKKQKTVYIASPIKSSTKRKNPQIKYNFVGSSQTKTYHKYSCRLSKSIKRKYKTYGQSKVFFKKLGYKPCKVCMKR
jgi:hypothetical protein